MIKSELIANLSAKMTHLTEQQVADSINHILHCMTTALASGRRIEIRGFGSFCLHYKSPRNAHNPKTGQRVITEGKHSPHFKPGKEMRERINQSRALCGIAEDD